ncbi:MAG: periplasmic heavy metal sensor [Pseudomonadales bacterium]|jgi:uncharacterized membrane protein|nr:periplasmic heavy metal sensor [Pseudomonadales bacterium]
MMRPKILLIALVISLAINLAMLGFAVARMIFEPTSFANAIHISPRWAHHLPDERRKELRPLLREQFKRARAHRPLLREKHKAVQRALAAEDFSEKSLNQALVELRRTLQTSQNQSHQDFSSFVTRLTASERKDLAKELLRRSRPRDQKQPRYEQHSSPNR